MAMPAACSDVPPVAAEPVLRFASKSDARDAALVLARSFTGRTTVIAVPHPYTRGSLTALCIAMAESAERIAAVVVELDGSDDVIYPRLLKKARELASAEGAVLIWCETVSDVTQMQGDLHKVYRIKPDLTCLTLRGDSQTWICGKPELMDHAKSL